MSKNLVIVESPAKAKTIEKFLGKEYHVMSSQGHICDIEGAGKNSIGIDFSNGYRPNYVVDPQKKNLLEQLRTEAKKADTVWLASDEDREGEAIAWHLKEALDLKDKPTKRIVFHEITKNAILEAIEKPRDIDYNLVNAQQARRVLDRIVGYELSPVLWKKITTGLSAGRVQSVAVRLVVEREQEIENFRTSAHYRVVADFTGRNPGDASILRTELNHKFSTKAQALEFLEQCVHADFKVESVQKRPAHRSPAPPFTTSSLQQEAARKLKFPVSKTMRLAQALYEAGHITYMRTDSVNLSSLAIHTAKAEIVGEYGEKYHHARQYRTASKGAQEAHEAIRPTYMHVHIAGANSDEKRLYELIWKRTIACQMADAEVEQTRIEVSMTPAAGREPLHYSFVATGEVVTFDGFMRAYIQSNDDEEAEGPRTLPQMALNEQLRIREMDAIQTYSKPPYRYNEATLVKKMEELGIGRPSTYASIIDTIQTRKYVERGSVLGKKREYNVLSLKGGKISDKQKQETYGSDLQKLMPTDLGRMTNSFLVAQFPDILSYDFTAKEEENFDRIADGQVDWVETVDTFYKTFHPILETIPVGKVSGRELGVDPATGEKVFAKISKIGPCIQIGDSDTEKPRFASLQKGQSIYTITLAEALELFRSALPYTLCQIEGKDVVIGEGKYGPYVHYDDAYISIPKDMDPLHISEEDVRQLIGRHQQAQLPLHTFGDIQVLNGRYGIYIKAPQGNFRIPKDMDGATLTEEQCRQIIATTAPAATQHKRFAKKK